jgi:hypothetical protein
MTTENINLSKYSHYWQDDLDKFGIIEDDKGRAPILVDLEDGVPVLIHENEEIVNEILKRMRDAGAKLISETAYRQNSWR